MSRSVSDRIEWFRAHRPERSGLCLRHTWMSTDIPPLGLDEAEDGLAAVKRAGNLKTDRNPPRGAWVWWEGGESGHVCLSLGEHRILSTDVEGKPTGTVPLSYVEEAWGYRYAGWSAWYGVWFDVARKPGRWDRLIERITKRIDHLKDRRREARDKKRRH